MSAIFVGYKYLYFPLYMKTISLLLLFVSCAFTSFSQHFFTIKEQDLYDCSTCPCPAGTPTFTLQAKPISRIQANDLFTDIKQNYGIEYRYPQGNCDDRAHYMARIIEKKGISVAKIWNFAPAKISLVFSDLLTVKDPNNFDPDGTISWGYHVAPIVFVEEKGKFDTLVIDPSLCETAVNYKQWLKLQGNTNSFYTFLNSEWYVFMTTNGLTAEDRKDNDNDRNSWEPLTLPDWFPSTITGDFSQYCMGYKDNHNVEIGLAINETAYLFYLNEIKPIENDANQFLLLNDYKTFAGKVGNFEKVLIDRELNNEMTMDFQIKYRELIEKYRDIFRDKKSEWIKKAATYLN